MKLQIKEAMSNTIPSWVKAILKRDDYYTRDMRRDIDIANTVWHELPVPSSSNQLNQLLQDPSKYVIIRFTDDHGTPVVYSNEYWSSSQPYCGGRYRNIDKVPKKYMLSNLIDIGYLDADPTGLKQKRSDRAKSRNGAAGLNRQKLAQYPEYKKIKTTDYWADENDIQGPRQQVWKTVDGYDKSGYKITGIEKYKNMLANMGLSNYEGILNSSFDAYEEFSKIFRMCRDSSMKIRGFREISNNFLDIVKQLDYYHNMYNKEQQTWKDNPNTTFGKSWYEDDVKKYIKRLRDQARIMKDFTKFIQSGEDIDAEDWKTQRRFGIGL